MKNRYNMALYAFIDSDNVAQTHQEISAALAKLNINAKIKSISFEVWCDNTGKLYEYDDQGNMKVQKDPNKSSRSTYQSSGGTSIPEIDIVVEDCPT